MSVTAEQGTQCELTFDIGIPGLVGTGEVMITDGQGNIVQPASTAQIVEDSPGSGIYTATRIAPVTLGQYNAIFSSDGSFLTGTVATEARRAVVTEVVSTHLPDHEIHNELAVAECFEATAEEVETLT